MVVWEHGTIRRGETQLAQKDGDLVTRQTKPYTFRSSMIMFTSKHVQDCRAATSSA